MLLFLDLKQGCFKFHSVNFRCLVYKVRQQIIPFWSRCGSDVVLSEWDFFNIFILFQCIMHWIHFQNTDTITYQKTLFHTLFCLFLKSSKTFSVSLIKSYQKFLHGLSFNRACAFFSIHKSPTWSKWTTTLRSE